MMAAGTDTVDEEVRALEMAPGTPKNTFLTMGPLEMETLLRSDSMEDPFSMDSKEDGDQTQIHSARVAALRQEAELRAEQQAMARETMLCLSEALEQSRDQIRELTRLLQNEQAACAKLRRKCDKLEADLEDALLEEEKRKAEELLKKGFASNNKLFINMMLTKSREAYQSELFPSPKGPTSQKGDADAADAADATQQQHSGAESSTQPREMGDTSAGHQHQPRSGQHPESGHHNQPDSGHQSQPANSKTQDLSTIHAGDRVTFTWILKLWLREVNLRKENETKQTVEDDRSRWEEEQRIAMQQEIEKRVGEMRRSVEILQSQLETANQTIEESRKRNVKLEKQLEAAAAEAQERERQHELAMMKQREEQLELQREITDKEAKIQNLQQLHEEAQAAFRRAEAQNKSEKKQLQDTIRRISSELQEAVVLAKYMREALIKCKRDASASISPAKFAELIAQLEAMRDSLKLMQKEHDHVKATNSDLHLKLEKNRRRLELERQFLPLIRKARGPLGMTDHMSDVLESPPALPEVRAPGKLQRSQSVSHVSRGHALSGAAGGS